MSVPKAGNNPGWTKARRELRVPQSTRRVRDGSVSALKLEQFKNGATSLTLKRLDGTEG